MHRLKSPRFVLILLVILILSSCKKIDTLNNDPDLKVLAQGFKSSAAIGYCASLASMAFNGEALPNNVVFEAGNNADYSKSGILYVKIDANHPLPFNSNIGDVVIAGLWDDTRQSGVISILFADIDLLSADFRFYGIHTVPIKRNPTTGRITTLFAQQDIVIGNGQDTIINLGLSRLRFDIETERANNLPPEDVFAAVSQNVWFVNVDQHNTFSDLYDDTYEISGGGQIAEVREQSGGLLYHALIKTRFNYANCSRNPISGTGFIQNLKAGSGSLDLGNIVLDFNSECSGKGKVSFAIGKYFFYNRQNVNLNFE